MSGHSQVKRKKILVTSLTISVSYMSELPVYVYLCLCFFPINICVCLRHYKYDPNTHLPKIHSHRIPTKKTSHPKKIERVHYIILFSHETHMLRIPPCINQCPKARICLSKNKHHSHLHSLCSRLLKPVLQKQIEIAYIYKANKTIASNLSTKNSSLKAVLNSGNLNINHVFKLQSNKQSTLCFKNPIAAYEYVSPRKFYQNLWPFNLSSNVNSSVQSRTPENAEKLAKREVTFFNLGVRSHHRRLWVQLHEHG